MDNRDYVKALGIGQEAQDRCLAAMEKYGDNHWWEPDVDPRKLAYYQINEPIMLGDFSHFHEAVELLVGRPVYSHEFATSFVEPLKQEAERAWKYQIGCTSDLERKERVSESVNRFVDWCKQNKKKVIEVRVDSRAS